MASPSFSPRKRRSALQLTLSFILATLVIAAMSTAGYAWWFHRTAITSLPQLDGTIPINGLSAPVSILRDQHGVPHITAANLDDLFFAQGFVTAQDRLWQMDINRRFGRGDLSEVLGQRTLILDKRQRTLQMRQAAERAAQALPQQTRHFLDVYARGVNALMERQRNHLPIEFRVLRYQPRPWTVEDSLMIGLNIAQNLNTQFDLEHDREALIARLSPQEITDLYPNSSWHDRPPSTRPRDLQQGPAVAIQRDPASLHALLLQNPAACEDCDPGSNNWVVSGARTVSGKPLLSNDMHLQHSIPNVWYEAHLTSGDFDAAGVSFPGLPWIIAGHNRHIAWGYTNLGPDVQDLFIENFNGQGEYQTPHGWLRPSLSHEVIKVKGGKDVAFDVAVTRHGPIVSSLFPGERRQLALQWTIYDPQTVNLPFFALDSAQDWKQFTAAIGKFGGAAQNIVYADTEGHIGYHAAGFVPIRAAGDGLVPVPGNTDQYEWTGYVPFDQLPNVFDPADGVIATANGRVTPQGYPHMLANQWGAPYRTERIYRVLEAGHSLNADDMLHLQTDTYSEFDRFFANSLVYAIDHSQAAPSRVRKAADLMRGWNGRMEMDSVAATITTRARRQLWRMILQPKIGAAWEDYHWFSSSIAMERLLRTQPPRWLPREYTNWDALLAGALEAALREAPAGLSGWNYGQQYSIHLNHPLFGGIPGLNRYSGPGVHPQSGSGLTVKAAGTTFGASQRMTMDLADLDASRLNIVAGQSGQIFSHHYLDHWESWYRGTTFQLPFTAGQVSKSAVHHLELRP